MGTTQAILADSIWSASPAAFALRAVLWCFGGAWFFFIFCWFLWGWWKSFREHPFEARDD